MQSNLYDKDIINLRIAKMCIKLNIHAKNINEILNSEDYLKEEVIKILFPKSKYS